jgi:hypothetical protein
MSAKTSSFLLLFRNTGAENIQHLTDMERAQLTQRWNDWYDALAASGKVRHGQPLELTGRVVSGQGGRSVIDGPFAEAKEAIGGYFMLHVPTIEEATKIAQECPSLAYGLVVEIRPIAERSPVLQGVKGRPPT